jgi:HlyD family secretion protein
LKKWLFLLLAIVAVVIAWGIVRKNTPPQVSFTRVKRQTLVSTLPANGKVEPIEWQAVRSESAGLVMNVPVQEGQTVSQGAVLAEMRDPQLAADIEAAEARVTEAGANLAVLQSGGRSSDLADIDNNLARARFDQDRQRSEYQALQRLRDKQAATQSDVQAAENKLRQTEIEIAGLEKRRSALVVKADVDAARARLQDAQTALNLARQRAALSVVHAPIAGKVYGLAVRRGAYRTRATWWPISAF